MMTEFDHRQTYCPVCKDTFVYKYLRTVQTDDQLIIRVSCPFCKRNLKIDLSPHSTRKVVNYKAGKGDGNNKNTIEGEALELELPDELKAT